MGKLVYQPPENYFVQVSICSLNTFLIPYPLTINLCEENKEKIGIALERSKGSTFILFPEYTYTDELQNQYQKYCDDNNCIIIGGSGLENVGDDFYAYAPVFIPNKELIKVYKRNITNEERMLSRGKIIPYSENVQRQIRIEIGDIDILFSVFVCYDFLVEHITSREDIVFVPQYERSPQQFIFEGDKIAKGWQNFVLGANNSNDNQRSLGFAILNSKVISVLSTAQWRSEQYNNGEGNHTNYHNTIIYDTQNERVLILKLNIGKPYSLPYDFSLDTSEPVIIPVNNFAIEHNGDNII